MNLIFILFVSFILYATYQIHKEDEFNNKKPDGHFEVVGELNEDNFSKRVNAKACLMSDGMVLITNGIDYSVFDIDKKEIKSIFIIKRML